VEYYISFLDLYIEILLGTVAFMTIVATLRQAFGKVMPKHQYLIVRYLVEVGLSHVFIAMLALAIVYFEPDLEIAMKYTYVSISAYAIPYLIFHTWRRTRQKAPTPLHSTIVMTGYVGLCIVILLAAFGYVIPRTMELIIAYLLWAFLAHIVIFFGFLGSFFKLGRPELDDAVETTSERQG